MSFLRLKFAKSETRTLRYQLKDKTTLLPVDITGMVFKFGAKTLNTDTSYVISPVTGTIDDATTGKFSFVLDVGATVFTGVFEVSMYDGNNKKTVLTPPGGQTITVSDDIID